MANRMPTLQVSVDGFHTISTISLQYTDSVHPDVPTAWTWDAAPMPTAPDVLLAIYGAELTIAEYASNDAAGTNVPRDRSEDSPYGGPEITRSVKAGDGSSTFAVVGRPGTMPEALMFAVGAALPAFLAAQGFVPPGP